nr:protein kinase [Deltaproteobacteria bacterium]
GDGSVYFVMEFLEGVELGSIIEREGALDVARALKIATQICRALAAAHAQGIVHRDLKPENVYLIARDGAADVVKVLDFGIAKTTEAEAARERRLTSPGMAMGTPEYMSPEQAAGRAADARCDVYALGAIMYEMTTGVPPYSGDNFMEILTKKATQDPPPPIMVRKDLPAQVSDLVMASMARAPQDRPQTMEKLEYELNKCLSGRGVAVAQILGMTTDANVVATLNPGLSMRITDEGIVRPPQAQMRAATHSGISALPGDVMSPLSGSWSGPTMATGQSSLPAMARMASEPIVATAASSLDSMRVAPARAGTAPTYEMGTMGSQPSMPIAPEKRSAIGILGWLLLATLLFGGVGALLYVALGERNQRAPSKLEGVAPPEQPVIKSETPEIKPNNGSAAMGSGSADNDTGSGAAGPGLKLDPPGNPAPPNKPPVNVRKPPVRVAINEKDPNALLKQGALFERTNNWEAARQMYEKLEGIKGYTGISQYQQAWVAFRTNDNQRAEDLSKRAIANTSGAWQFRAKTLYADALYGKGLYQRAKDLYLSLRNGTSVAKLKADLAKKIMNCNKGLKLPNANDGL